jgi:hypothetical protein
MALDVPLAPVDDRGSLAEPSAAGKWRIVTTVERRCRQSHG